MNPVVLSSLVGAGLIRAKSRILLFRDIDGSARLWLSRRRFKVDTPETVADSGALTRNRQPCFEVVLVHWEQGHGLSDAAQADMLREAVKWVRPSGHLIVTYEADGLFAEDMRARAMPLLRGCLCPDAQQQITPFDWMDGAATFGFVIKKGGFYKPRCPVSLIDAPESFSQTCKTLMRETHIGLDVETTLNEPRILCTVQLATESRVYVLDMLPIKDLAPLKQLMESDDVLKIIHNKAFEQKVLGHYGIQINSVYDTLIEARKRSRNKHRRGHKLSDVCERDLGVYLDKSLQVSDWTRRPLTDDQLNYAAADAEVLMRLYRLFVPPKPPETMALF